MRLSLQSRNSVKHKSASVEFAYQTGDRVLTVRLEFNYKNRSKLFEARDTNFESIFLWGLANSLSLCWRIPTRVCNSRTDVWKLSIADWEAAIVFIKEVRH